MNKKFKIFLIFSFLAFFVVGLSVYDSSVFKSDKSSAEGFGISPPYFKNDNLEPGQIYSQKYRILRSQAKTKARAEIIVDAPDINSWITVEPGNKVNLGEGDLSTPMKIEIKVPADAKAGNYKGAFYVTLLTDENYSGVGIRTGAMAEIDLKVIGQDKGLAKILAISDSQVYDNLKGSFIGISGQENSLYYISPAVAEAIYCGLPEEMKQLFINQGIGISNKDLEKIPIGIASSTAIDTDQDDLFDNLESALGTDITSADTDRDGFSDYDEIKNGFSPLGKSKNQAIDLNFAEKQKGRIFLQVENRGQAWYVYPADNKRYFLSTPTESLNILRSLAVSVTQNDFDALKEK